MTTPRALILALICTLFIAGCSEIDEFLGTNRCSTYNAERDGFRIEVTDSNTVMGVGGSHTLGLERSWLNNDLRRVSLDCLPDWSLQPEGVVEVDGTTVTAVAPGTVEIRAVVSGGGGTKSSSVTFAVVPPISEDEPNNGMPAANELVQGVETVGHNDYSGDEDWFYADLGPGKSLQFTLRRSIDADHLWFSYDASGTVYDASGDYVTSANRTVTNGGLTATRYYLRVTSSGVIPYAAAVDFVD